jgi:putative FmdB family regulatory protein
MPLYEYICKDCGHEFDAIRSIKESDSRIECDECRSDHTSRKISLFFAQSGGRVVAGGNSGCAGCGGDTCASCGGH